MNKRVFITNEACDKVLSKSKNLAVIIRYNTGHAVRLVVINQTFIDTGLLSVYWENGAQCHTEFNSYSILHEWVNDRRAFTGRIITGSALSAARAIAEVRKGYAPHWDANLFRALNDVAKEQACRLPAFERDAFLREAAK